MSQLNTPFQCGAWSKF